MSSAKEIRARAAASLKGRWGEAILVTVIVAVIALVVEGIAAALSNVSGILGFAGMILTMFISIFLEIGMIKYFLKLARGEEADYRILFDASNFNSVGRLFLIAIVEVIIIALASIVVIPGMILAYSYMFAIVIAIEEEIGIDALKKSRLMMKGYKWKLFCLILSFIGWIILATITLGIGMLWVGPYMQTALMHFYDEVKYYNNPTPAVDTTAGEYNDQFNQYQ